MKISKQIVLLFILILLFNQSWSQAKSDKDKIKIKWKDVVMIKYDPSIDYNLKFGEECLQGEAIIHTKYMTDSLEDLTKREVRKIKKKSAKYYGKVVFIDIRQKEYLDFGLHSVYYLWISCNEGKI